MKRLLSLLVLVIFVCSFAAAESLDLAAMSDEELRTLRDEIDAELLSRSAGADEDPILGIWYLTEVVMNGQTIGASAAGVEASMEIKPDMTFTLTANGTRQTGSWSRDGGKYILEGSETIMSGDMLTVKADDFTMVYIREKVQASIPRAVPALSEEEFLGEWVLDKVGQNGVVVPMSAAPQGMNVQFSISVKPGSVFIVWDGIGLPAEYASSFADGRLEITSVDSNNLGFQYSPLEMTDEGEIMTTISGGVGIEPVTVYLKKVTD